MKKILKKTKIAAKKVFLKGKAYLVFVEDKIGFLGAEIQKSFHLGKMSFLQGMFIVLIVGASFFWYAESLGKYYYEALVSEIPTSKTLQELKKEQLENRIRELVKGTPIEIMAPYIAESDKETAAFLIGIARKESNWGKRRPVLNGQDCFNYWGYRGKSETMGSGGHTCFGSPEEAVEVVSRRLEQIVKKNGAHSAKNMVVWKCGYSCAAHSPESVSKWIKDVDMYADKILN